ncbi:MAG: restriction endonuclease subunit S [Sulfurovum sp.]|nr:restriction endonuclease subunit S [Sulfurovum sp.]
MNEKLGMRNEGWRKIELSDVFEISKNKFNPKTTNKNEKCIELEHISQGTGKLLGYTNSSEQQSIKNIFKKNQVLFGKLRPYLKKYWKADFEGVCSTEIWVLDGKSITNDFLFQFIQTEKFNQVANVSSGSKMPRADWKYMAEIPFNIPPLKEQQKIAQILSTWDDAISKQEELIVAKEQLKIGLMQRLLSGEVRFAGFDGEWEYKNANLLFKTISNKDHNSDLPILAISQDLGAVPRHMINYKITATEKSISGYKVIEKGDFIISLRSFQGGIEYSNYKGICSPAYIILRPYVTIEDVFYKYYFKTHKYIQQLNSKLEGIRDGKMISYKYFSEIKIPFPSMEEQQKIAQVLTAADKEIELLKSELTALKEQKRGLMQRLLSGVVRVKV